MRNNWYIQPPVSRSRVVTLYCRSSFMPEYDTAARPFPWPSRPTRPPLVDFCGLGRCLSPATLQVLRLRPARCIWGATFLYAEQSRCRRSPPASCGRAPPRLTRIGRTVSPDDLAPRPKGRHLAAPCGSRVSGQPFDGRLTGTLTGGTTSLDVDVVLSRSGERVTGSYSFGAGFARLEGTMQGSTLNFRWKMPPDGGAGRITLRGGEYRGTWGNGDSTTDGGPIALRRDP